MPVLPSYRSSQRIISSHTEILIFADLEGVGFECPSEELRVGTNADLVDFKARKAADDGAVGMLP